MTAELVGRRLAEEPGVDVGLPVPRLPWRPARGALRVSLGIVSAPSTRYEDYGPTSALSEDLLLQGYGLRRPGLESLRAGGEL